MRTFLLLVMVASWLPFGEASALATTLVSNDAELAAAIASSDGGVIALAHGTYGDVAIRDKSPSTTLTVTSADPNLPATVNGWVWIERSVNISVDSLRVDPSSVAAFDDWLAAVNVHESENISISNLELDGHIVGPGEGVDPDSLQPGDPNPEALVGYGYGTGLAIRYSTDVVAENLEIHHFRVGAFFQNSERVTASSLHIHDIRTDGIDLEDLRDTVIQDSRFESFHPWLNTDGTDSDHADMIQFWGANGDWGIEDLVIRRNVFLQRDGDWTQTIFGHLSGGDPSTVKFSRFDIADNLIVNSHFHGITLGNVLDSDIHHNLLLPAPGYQSANTTSGLPEIFMPDGNPTPAGNRVHSNIMVAPGTSDSLGEYFGSSFGANEIGSNTLLRDDGYQPYFLDVFSMAHQPFDDLPDLRISPVWGGSITAGHGPRWLDLSKATGFLDTQGSVFEGDIQWMASEGITQGCGAGVFCPDDPVTRGQMAAFFSRFLSLPDAPVAHFIDTAGSPFTDDINRLAATRITLGCSEERYCPDDLVTRAQMATFFSRALDLPPGPPPGFVDATASVFSDDIARLAAAGITHGCARDLFCPELPITRGQMAAFFRRASLLTTD